MIDLTGSVAVVTGAGRGIGEAIAEKLHEQGARIAVVSQTPANAERVAQRLNAARPDSARPYAVDVAHFEAMQALGKQVTQDFGGVDVLVNNAGITRDGLCLRMSEDDWNAVLNTNLKGAFNAVKALQRALLKSPRPRVVNISSVIGLMGNAGQVNYAASKAGLIGFTKSLAREYASRGLTANVICPGFITTDMTSELTEDQKAAILGKIPLSRLGEPKDVAWLTAFLCGEEARYITGQVIAVDGGMVM